MTLSSYKIHLQIKLNLVGGKTMALSYKNRRRWSLVILLIGLPSYVVACIFLVSSFERPSVLVELLVYVTLGLIWALPFKFVFRGIGQADPDKEKQ